MAEAEVEEHAISAIWRRAQEDAAFRARIHRHYHGQHDLQDALWWFSHPGTPSPAGTPDPAVRVAQLHRNLYAGVAAPTVVNEYLRAAEAVAQEELLTARAIIVASRSHRMSARGQAVVLAVVLGGLVAITLLVGGVLIPAGLRPASAPLSSPSSGAPAPVITAVRLADPRAAGTTLLRLTSSSPRVGTQPESGTTAFQSDLVDHPSSQVMLTLTCQGGADLLVVAGQGLSNGGFTVLSCPADEPATVRAVLPQAVTQHPFRMVAYEREPSTWKLLLSTYPAN